MAHIETKAHQLRDEAEKKLSGGFFRTFFTNAADRIDESIDYYIRAGNLFKMAKNWSQAGGAFSDAAELSLRNGHHVEAAVNFVEAGNCFKRCDTVRARDFYLKAIEVYRENGKFLMAAKYHQLIGDMLEDVYDSHEAMEHYEKAADFYKQECSFSAANKCLERIAEYAAISGDYSKAISIFQNIACFDLASSLMKYTAKNYLFRAALCLLCTDSDIETKLQAYVQMYPAFEDSEEFRLVACLLECVEEGHEERFSRAVKQFDSFSQLSQWQLTLLQRIKGKITGDLDLK